MQTIFSGINPTGDGNLHIGNYFGAVKQFLDLQEKAHTIFFIADLHVLTTIQDKETIRRNIFNLAINYLSLGIDPEKSIFFRQSSVYAHPYLASILGNFTPLGLMQRAHAYKDKLEKNALEEDINMGLFCYPILMASDILLYKPDLVPVGKDQKQHVEITRDIAQRFNTKVDKNIFPLPEAYIPNEVGKVIGTDGERKMSKSLKNTITIFDSPDVIKKQIMATVTDPNRIHPTDKGRVEGNVIFDYHDLLNENVGEVNDLKIRYKQGKVGDVEVKEKLFIAHQKFFAKAIEKQGYFESHPEVVYDILTSGAQKAEKIALATLHEVKDALGLL